MVTLVVQGTIDAAWTRISIATRATLLIMSTTMERGTVVKIAATTKSIALPQQPQQ